MRTTRPIAFAVAVSAHVGLLGAGALFPHWQDRNVPASTVVLGLKLDFVDAPSERLAAPNSPPIRPPEPVAFAALDPAMPPAESLPATSDRVKLSDRIGTIHEALVRRGVVRSLLRVPDELASLRSRARMIASTVRGAALDAHQHWPSLPHSTGRPHRAPGDSGFPSADLSIDVAAATTRPSAGSPTDAGSDSDVVALRGPVPSGGNHPPIYPAEAARQRLEGVVTVRLRVGSGGEVLDAGVARSSGSSLLDAAALTATRAWRFEPAIDALGRGVECQANIPITFRLR